MELNKIYNENCLETMKRMPDNFVDMTLTSPPYDNLRDYKGYSFDFESIAKELFRITKEGGVVVWVVGDATINGSESGTSFKQALFFKECGFNLHDTMIYYKNNWVPLTHNRFEQSFEYMFVFSKGRPRTFNPIMIKCTNFGKTKSMSYKSGTTNENASMRSGMDRDVIVKEEKIKNNVWDYDIGAGKSSVDKYAFEHPAIFPEKLASDHIKSWSNEGDLIYDPFMGSGTTGKMAVMLKRNYIGSEISEEYTKLAEERIKSISNTLF